MYLSEDYWIFEIHQQGEQRLLRDLERRRVIAERAAERPEVSPSPRRQGLLHGWGRRFRPNGFLPRTI
ncbi:MAG: hypothetical protein ABWX82_07900 [Leifsonia sp.]